MSSTDCVDIIENLVYEYVKPLGFRKHGRTLHRFFTITEPLKKYYYEYECNIRTRLGSLVDGKDSFYDLKKFKKIATDVIERVKEYVMPIFKVLDNREGIIQHRAEYSSFDQFSTI